MKWPLLPSAHTLPLHEGVTLYLLTALSLLTLLGVRHLEKLLPPHVSESVWKVLCLSLVALPRALEGSLNVVTQETVLNCSLVVVILVVTPWRHDWRTYVRDAGVHWR